MNFKIFLALIFIIIPFSFFSCNEKKENPVDQPNILFIIADDYGYHDLSSRGSDYYETPNLDRLAGESMIFTNGYSAHRVCSPARASIMSGKFPARHGITDWIGARTGEDWREQGRHSKLLPPDYVDHLPHEYHVLPEAMKENGYKTFFAGKWHLGNEGSYPEDHGFDINQGGFEAGGPYTGGYFSPFNNPKMDDHPEEKGMSLPEKLAKETSSFIEQYKDTTFFAFLSFYAVHSPIQSSQEKWRKYRDKAEAMGIAETGFEMGYFLPIRQVQDNPVYAGLVEHMDDAVGSVLETLKTHGLEENTIVIFTSDHGGVAAGDNYSTSNLPLRGGKGYQYEGGLKVPYFIKVPWLDHHGTENHTPVNGTDFYPTILDLTDNELRPDEHQDGVSLVPLLKGSSIAERPLIWHYPHYGNQGGRPSSVIREGTWKLIRYHADSSEVLYDLEKDFREATDVYHEHPQIAERLSNRLSYALSEMGAKFPEVDPLYDTEKEAQYLKNIEEDLLPRLEKQRLEYLSKDFDPENNWWGSETEN